MAALKQASYPHHEMWDCPEEHFQPRLTAKPAQGEPQPYVPPCDSCGEPATHTSHGHEVCDFWPHCCDE